MKKEKKFKSLYILFIILCLCISGIVLLPNTSHLSMLVLFITNILLFVLGRLHLQLEWQSIHSKNPHVWMRTSISTTLVKMLVLALAALLYLWQAKNHRSVISILIGCFFYFLYLIVETKVVLTWANKKNSQHIH